MVDDSDTLTVAVRAMVRSSRSGIEGVRDGQLLIRTTAVPVDGKANKDLARQLAREFRVPPSAVQLIRGARHRNKTFRITMPANLPPWLAELHPKR